jgi:hypothetical protein
MAAKKGPNFIFFMQNRTTCILSVHTGIWDGDSVGDGHGSHRFLWLRDRVHHFHKVLWAAAEFAGQPLLQNRVTSKLTGAHGHWQAALPQPLSDAAHESDVPLCLGFKP